MCFVGLRFVHWNMSLLSAWKQCSIENLKHFFPRPFQSNVYLVVKYLRKNLNKSYHKVAEAKN